MEHDDNNTQQQLDNFLQNSQNLVENLQMASGGVSGVGDGGLVAGGNAGFVGVEGKLVEHEEHVYDEEWKYIKEVQQSEKQPAVKDAEADFIAAVGGGVGGGEFFEKAATAGGEFIFGNGGGSGGANDFFNNGIGVGVNANVDFSAAAAGVDEEEEVEIIKNDGDFSTTSNTTTSTGEEMKIDVQEEEEQQQQEAHNAPQQQLQQQQQQHEDGATEEEEPSSLATNGTSSLSETAPAPQPELHQYDGFDDKENSDPLLIPAQEQEPAHPTELSDLEELHSQLNPDAKEFVPNFGAPQPTSAADIGISIDVDVGVGEVVEEQPHPSAVPRYLLTGENAISDDDVIAGSPRKERDIINMDGISLPGEDEFEHEAARRPHELEQDYDLNGDGVTESTQPLPLTKEKLEGEVVTANLLEMQSGDFIDHGPETSVDLDVESIPTANEVTKECLDKSIEDLLNTVQPLPSDEETYSEGRGAAPQHEVEIETDKELLHVEEKEHVSHSPSTEEMQMIVEPQADVSFSSIKDIPQLPIDIDMDNAAHMQESFYMEHNSADADVAVAVAAVAAADTAAAIEPPRSADIDAEHSLLMDTTIPKGVDDSCVFDNSFQQQTTVIEQSPVAVADDSSTAAALSQDEPFFGFPEPEPEGEMEQVQSPPLNDFSLTPTPPVEEEKHLLEETKEQICAATEAAFAGVSEFEQKMNDLSLDNEEAQVGNLLQMGEIPSDANSSPPVLAKEEHENSECFFDVPPSPPSVEINPIDAAAFAAEAALLASTTELPTEISSDTSHVLMESPAVVAASAAIVGAAGATVASKPVKKTSKAAPLNPKPKVGETVAATGKKPAGTKSTSAVTARPRTAPAKTATAAEKKPVATTAAAAAAAKSMTARRPLTASADKPAPATTGPATARPSTARPSTARPTTARPTTARPSASKPALATAASKTVVTAAPKTTAAPRVPTTARKSTLITNGSNTTAAAAPKPRQSVAPTKPTTLGLPVAAAKPKLITPRPTLTSQLRKAPPSTTAAAAAATTTAAKSPVKVAATNGGHKSRVSTTSVTTSRTTSKTFTARPAPRTTGSTLTTTSRRLTTTSAPTATSGKTSANIAAQRKIASPTAKPSTVTLGAKLSPSKSVPSAQLKPKTKEPIGGSKTSPIKESETLKKKKQQPMDAVAQTNGSDLSTHNGGGDMMAPEENGAVDVISLENGGGSGEGAVVDG